MKEEIIKALKQYKHEILRESDNGIYVEDWWHYFPYSAINVHDYDENGIVSIDVYPSTDETGILYDCIQESYEFTIEEFKNL
jgi:hypothetical protein